jgi:hypothetical protein
MINRRTRHLHNYHCPNEATRQNIKTVNEATKQSTFSVSTKTEHLSEKKKTKTEHLFVIPVLPSSSQLTCRQPATTIRTGALLTV